VVLTSREGAECPVCGGKLSFGYGFAGGGGIGDYAFCLDCDRIIAKKVDVPGESFVWAPGDDPGESE
jgi:hypothetical protein